jgi:diguanylate cyclase (GGDEF)-like protein
VCRWLRHNDATRFIPVLMLTARDQLRDKVHGLNVGANDYLAKPVQTEELEARIFVALRAQARHLELQHRNGELETMLQDVERLAITDSLTGVFNRRRFSDVLEREVAVSRRYHHSLCCVLADIDHFKRINDAHGHGVGDQVLKQVARALAATLREVDLVARYGGEEFAFLLPHTDKSSAIVAVRRVAETLRGLTIAIDGATFGVTASFGVSCTDDIPSADPNELVRAADLALYQAKKNGRDRIEVYNPPDSVPDSL